MKKLLPLAILSALLPCVLNAQTYIWNGTSSSNWQTSANWSASPGTPAFNTTIAGRIDVSNGANNSLIYTSAEGATSMTGTGVRGLVVASGTSGQMIITGGSFSTENAGTGDIVGNGAGVTGGLTVSGGSYVGSNSGGLSLALSGASVGNFTVNAGTASVTSLTLGGSSAGTATVNLNGGTLSASSIRTSGGSSTMNFNGGTLRARFSSTTFMTGLTRANVRNGGAVIDTNNTSTTIGQALLHSNVAGDNVVDGGLIKNGAGILTLAGANAYTGKTVVNAGTLSLANGGQLQFSFNNGDFNSVSGVGALSLSGAFIFDLTGALEGTYDIIEASILGSTIFGSTFSVANSGWTEADNVWTSADALFSFSELNGQLVVAVPEPGTTTFLALGGLLGLVIFFRRKRVTVAKI